MSGFEIFERGLHRNPRNTPPFVTILRGVRICFSKPLAEFLEASHRVLYLIDREGELFAVKPCGDTDNGYTVRHHGAQASVSAKAALEHVGLKHGMRIPATIEDGMIVFSYAVARRLAGSLTNG